MALKTVLLLSAAAFTGKDAVSPRLIVDLFSPWTSDNWPNLVHSVDLDSVAKNGNRLFCTKLEAKPDGGVECRENGEVSYYKHLGQMKNGVHAFITQSSSDSGTFVATTFRFVSIAKADVYTINGKKEQHSIMTLVRDVPIEHKASFKHAFTKDKSGFEIETERFQDGKKVTTVVTFD